MNNQQKWIIRQYLPDDEDQIFQLRNAVRPEEHYNRNEWLQWWHWTYKVIPEGSKIWLLEIDGKIVGLFSLLYTNMKIGDRTIKTAQSIDESTHPDYRRRGVMSALQTHVIAEETQNGIEVFFGFPTDMAYTKDIKLGYLKVDELKKIYRVLHWDNALRNRISCGILRKLISIVVGGISGIVCKKDKLSVDQEIQIYKIDSFDERINNFWDRVSKQINICAVRNNERLNWRYATVPNTKYEIFQAEKAGIVYGYIVLRYLMRRESRVAVIYDLMAETEEVSQYLLQTAIEESRANDIDYIYWAGISNERYQKAFKERGFIQLQIGQLSRFLVYSRIKSISQDFLTKPENWLVQIGDSDQL